MKKYLLWMVLLSVFFLIGCESNTISQPKTDWERNVGQVGVIPICEDEVICYHLNYNGLSCVKDSGLTKKYCEY